MKKKTQGTCAKCHKQKVIHYKAYNNFCLDCLPDDRRCTHMTRQGTRCKLPTLPGKYICKNHASKRFRKLKIKEIDSGLPGGRGPGYVYIIDLGRENYYKIGQTRNGNQRLTAMQTSNPWAVFIFCEPVCNASHVEKKLHRTFKNQRIQREIFCLTENDIEKAREYVKEHYYEHKR